MNRPTLGIDISKLKFNVCLIKANGKLKHKVFSNTLPGFEQLSFWLSQHDATNAHACLEATGTYGCIFRRNVGSKTALSWAPFRFQRGHRFAARGQRFAHRGQ